MYTPLYSALSEYANKKNIPFHMPGNKGGMAIPQNFQNDILSLDFTEISATDNLASPNSCILDARKVAAEAFGAVETFFITCGSTCGIMAMLAYACGRGGKIITDRNCHASVINAFALLGIQPIFIYPNYLEAWGITSGISAEAVERALNENPDVCGAIITSPNYYGICSDLKAISYILHKKDKLLLVDEAHGAHFAFSPLLPKTAMECGADIAVQSVHKTIPALGQSAIIHISSEIDGQQMQNMINLFHTSSPSYILMAYIDLARAIMQKDGEKIYQEQKQYIDELHCDKFEILNNNKNIFDQDFTRLCIKLPNISGYTVSERLENECGIVAEMADLYNVVLIGGAGINQHHYKQLKNALLKIAETSPTSDLPSIVPPFSAEIAMPIDKAFWSKKTKCNLKTAEGKISGGTIVCYPPAVPVILPGEIIKRSHIDYIEAILKLGGKVIGETDGMASVIVC